MQYFWGSKGIASFLELYLAEFLRYLGSKRVTLWALYTVCSCEDCLDSKAMECILFHYLMNSSWLSTVIQRDYLSKEIIFLYVPTFWLQEPLLCFSCLNLLPPFCKALWFCCSLFLILCDILYLSTFGNSWASFPCLQRVYFGSSYFHSAAGHARLNFSASYMPAARP